MDSSQKSDEGVGQATSSHIVWDFSEEDKEETFDSAVTQGLIPVSKVTKTADCKDPSPGRSRASDNWQLLLHKLGKKASRLENKTGSGTALPELKEPSTSQATTSCKVISCLKLESFSLPQQQMCVVREEPPTFAQGLLIDKEADSCRPGELEVPKNIPVLNQDTHQPQKQSVESVESSSFAEATHRKTSHIKRHSTTGPHLPNFHQRQQELHRYRVLIEQRRLELLELRIAREREEAKQYMILFQKKMQSNECNSSAPEANDFPNV